MIISEMKIQIIIKKSTKSNRSFSIILLLLTILSLGLGSNMSLVSASSENDVSCYDRGIIDGEDHPFNQRTFNKCGEDYYQGFLQGCMSVDGNDRDICESATDG